MAVLLYSSTAQGAASNGAFLTQQISVFDKMATSEQTAKAVAKELHLSQSPQQLLADVNAFPSKDGSSVTIAYTDKNVTQAITRVKAWVVQSITTYQDSLRLPAQQQDSSLRDKIAALETDLTSLDQQIAEIKKNQPLNPDQEAAVIGLDRKRSVEDKQLQALIAQLGGGRTGDLSAANAIQIQTLGAPVVVRPQFSDYLVKILLGGLLGLVIGACVAIAIDLLSKSVASIEDAEALTGSVVLSVIPTFPKLTKEAANTGGANQEDPGRPQKRGVAAGNSKAATPLVGAIKEQAKGA